MLRRNVVMASVLLLVSLSWCWRFAGATGGQRGNTVMAAPMAFEIPVRGERAAWEWDTDDPHEYTLIVSSLGDASQEYRVQLQTRPATGRAIEPPQAVPPLRRSVVRSQKSSPANPGGGTSAQVTAADVFPEGPSIPASRSALPARSVMISNPAVTSRTFDIHTGAGRLEDPASYTRVRSRLVAESPSVRIFLDEQHPRQQLAEGLLDDITTWLEQQVLPRSRELWGRLHHDIDADGKLAVLLTPWLGRLQGGKTALWGFVRGSDFRHDMAAPFSNQADVIYLNTDLTPGSMLRTVLAHEYTHAVNFSLRLHPGPGRSELPDEEDWLNEGFAHVAETLHESGWANLDYRVSRFLDEPQRYPLVIPDYFRAGLWREHGCRGATFLFLRWCTDHFGTSLLREMATRSSLGVRNLEEATGHSFADLYRQWTLALAEPSSRAFPSVDLHGSLGQWPLAGPRHIPWNSGPDGDRRHITLRGTSTAFLDLQRSSSTSRQRFEIAAPPGTRLQVTLVRRPAPRPRFSVDASIEFASAIMSDSSSTASGGDNPRTRKSLPVTVAAESETADGEVRAEGSAVQATSTREGSSVPSQLSPMWEDSPVPRGAFVRLRIAGESSLAGWHLESVTWERNQGEEQRCIPVPLAAAHRYVPFPLTDAEGCTLPAQLKIRLRDAQGRMASTWVTLAPQPSVARSPARSR